MSEQENQIVEVTPEMLASVHEEKENLRGKIDQAKGRLEVILNQIQNTEKEFEKLNIKPEEAPEKIASLEKEISDLYLQAKSILEGIKNVQGNNNGN